MAVKIPDFIERIVAGDIAGAAAKIAEDSSLPAVCGRVCPQESQCEGSCVLGVKFEPVSIGKLERFVADWTFANAGDGSIKVPRDSGRADNGHRKVAVIGSGPAGLTCAGDLRKLGYDVTIFERKSHIGGIEMENMVEILHLLSCHNRKLGQAMACVEQIEGIAQKLPLHLLSDVAILGDDNIAEGIGQGEIAMSIGMRDLAITEGYICII